jgi:hypothetical protein
MAETLKETAGLALEIETLDPSLASHTNLKVWYIPPQANGDRGLLANALPVLAIAVAGLKGNSVAQGTPITIVKGIYTYWCESDNPAGLHCVSPAFDLFVIGRETPEHA